MFKWLKNISISPRLSGPPAPPGYYSTTSHKIKSRELVDTGLEFRVISGIGGVAIEVSQYNSKDDQVDTVLYIIPANEDLAETLSKIVTLSVLRKQ